MAAGIRPYAPIEQWCNSKTDFELFVKEQGDAFEIVCPVNETPMGSFEVSSAMISSLQGLFCRYNLDQIKQNLDQANKKGLWILEKKAVEMITVHGNGGLFDSCAKIGRIFSRLLILIWRVPSHLLKGDCKEYMRNFQWLPPQQACIQVQKIARAIPGDVLLANNKTGDGKILDLISMEELPEANRVVIGSYAMNLGDLLRIILNKEVKADQRGIPHPFESRLMNEKEVNELCRVLGIVDVSGLMECWKLEVNWEECCSMIDGIFREFFFPALDPSQVHEELRSYYERGANGLGWESFYNQRMQQVRGVRGVAWGVTDSYVLSKRVVLPLWMRIRAFKSLIPLESKEAEEKLNLDGLLTQKIPMSNVREQFRMYNAPAHLIPPERRARR